VTWLQFFAELAKALGWPIAVVFMVIFLRHPLKDLIRNVRRFKYRDFELDWGEKLESAERKAEAAQLPRPAPAELPPGILGLQTARYLASEADSRAGIIEAWRHVEEALWQTALRADVLPRWRTARALTRELLKRGLISAEVAGLLDDLRVLRNQTVHTWGVAPNAEQAEEYISLAERVIRFLRERSSSQRRG
jgi:hypothetical protein